MAGLSDNLLEFIKYKEMSIRSFEASIGASHGMLHRSINKGTDIQSKWLEKIIITYPDLNIYWLLTGEGEMIKNSVHPTVHQDNLDPSKIAHENRGDISSDISSDISNLDPSKIAHEMGNPSGNLSGNPSNLDPSKIAHVLKKEDNYAQPEGEVNLMQEPTALYNNSVPLVAVTAVGGFGSEHFAIEPKDVLGYYKVPEFSGANFLIRISGESMSPQYPSGAVIACSIIRNSTFFQWGKVHVVATKEQGIIVKRLKNSEKEGFILCLSDNPEFPPFEIPREEITGLACVIGRIMLD